MYRGVACRPSKPFCQPMTNSTSLASSAALIWSLSSVMAAGLTPQPSGRRGAGRSRLGMTYIGFASSNLGAGPSLWTRSVNAVTTACQRWPSEADTQVYSKRRGSMPMMGRSGWAWRRRWMAALVAVLQATTTAFTPWARSPVHRSDGQAADLGQGFLPIGGVGRVPEEEEVLLGQQGGAGPQHADPPRPESKTPMGCSRCSTSVPSFGAPARRPQSPIRSRKHYTTISRPVPQDFSGRRGLWGAKRRAEAYSGVRALRPHQIVPPSWRRKEAL